MNKKKIIIFLICVIIFIVISLIIIAFSRKKENAIDENKQEIKEIETQKEMTEEEKMQVNEVQKTTGVTGNAELYEIQEDYGTKVAVVKPNIKYKVAFCGMIKGERPDISELDEIISNNHPKYAGIWIYEKDREKVLKSLKNYTQSEYKIDNDGYLRITNKTKQNDNDLKLEKMITGKKLYMIRISSICYIVDDVSGEILDYNFEDMDYLQIYEYFKDDDKTLIFINENKESQLSEEKIINSLFKLYINL